MAYFDPAKETSILVDASPFGLGAILVQDNKAICHASRALTDVKKRYSQTDREMLAAVYGVEHFHLYVHHKLLLGIVKSRNPTTARIERWRLQLMRTRSNSSTGWSETNKILQTTSAGLLKQHLQERTLVRNTLHFWLNAECQKQ